MTSAISIIIPAINEAACLPGLLDGLARQVGVALDVIVVDAGSEDDTAKIAAASGARVFHSAPGRGRQMNLGASHAHHEFLLFLHADSALEDPAMLGEAASSWQQQREALGTGRLAGHFSLAFACKHDPCALNYCFLEAKSALNRPYTFNGDQGILIERAFFDELGRFDESMSFLEDQRIGRVIHARGHWMTLPGTLTTSARRFETEGFGARYVVMAVMMGAFVAEIEEFFEALPHVYATQDKLGPLELEHFLNSLYPVVAAMGPHRSAEVFVDVGEFVRRNAWQLALLADVLAGSGPRALPAFDAHLAAKLDTRFFDVLAGTLTFGLLLGVLPATSWLARRAGSKKTIDAIA
ncbi:MAG: TIGR04283 family arsenosugar biosynthesis glycosyltransferase [Bradymonadaceae bacterium]|nr:TIGR04283 family arsenosugar biosynthesis glycosyltransferase [Lujinxingiaceae bacterium]